jgi:predicted phage terminase large subunit-like protein
VEPELKKLRVMIYVDPAFSTGRKSDYSALVVMGMDQNGQMWILEIVRGKMLDDELVNLVFAMDKRWHPEAVGIEANAAQKLFGKIFKLESERRNHNIKIRPIIQNTNRSKEYRIRGLMPFIERGQIKFHVEQTELLTEFRRWSINAKEHDDQLDAIEGCLGMLKPSEYREAPNIEKLIRDRQDYIARDKIFKPEQRKPTFSDSFGRIFA